MHPWPRAGLAVLLIAPGCLGPESATNGSDEPTPPAPWPPGPAAWTEMRAAPTPRTEVVVGILGSDIYVVGGFTVLGDAPVASHLVEVYDAASDAWRAGPSYPLQIHHSAAVAVGGSLYMLGGLMTAAFQPTALAFRLDASTGAWLPIAPLPAARGGHAAVAVDGRIFVAGGVTGNAMGTTHLGTAHVYDPGADEWFEVRDALPTPRDHTAGVALGKRFCVLGGDVGGHGENTNATECLDTTNGTWTAHAPVPTLRGSVAAAPWLGRAVVLGGQNATQTFDAVEAFDAENDTWTALPPLRQARHGFGVAAWGDALFSLSGGPQPGLSVTGSVERLTVAPG